MQIASLVLEYLRVLLSAAPVAGIAVFVFFFFFRSEIRDLIARIATIRFPGGELSTTQLGRGNASPAEPQIPPQIDASNLSAQLNLAPDQVKRLVEFIQAERERSTLWEYRFLNYYFVRHTQLVLDWLISLNKRTTLQMFDSFWLSLIHDPDERVAVLNALRAHHLVNVQGDMIEVTLKGQEYVKWRGPLPQPLPSRPLQSAIGMTASNVT